MVNNEHAQSSQNVFQRQSHTANGQQPRGSVGQDKGVPTFDRVASYQPASLRKGMRSHEMETKNSRSQNHSNAKRKTVPLQLWVHPLVKAEIQRTAEQE